MVDETNMPLKPLKSVGCVLNVEISRPTFLYNFLLDQFREDVCHITHFPKNILSMTQVSKQLRIRTVELLSDSIGLRCYLPGSVVADLGFHQRALQADPDRQRW